MSERKSELEIVIDGFCFALEEEAEQAKKEVEGVAYIREKNDMENPEMVLQIYNKIIQQKLFETAVGYSYLRELQEYLKSVPMIADEDILPIPVLHRMPGEASLDKRSSGRNGNTENKERRIAHADYKKKFQVTLFVSIVLVICVAAMFLVAATANNSTILNYETNIINKYENWEQELTERENAVREREQELGITQTAE